DPGRMSAKLVPGEGETAPAGTFNYIGNSWVRQSADGLSVAPAIGSEIIFGSADARLRADIDLTASPFNLRPAGHSGSDEDQSAALTDAVDLWTQNRSEPRKIISPAGK